MASPGSKDPPEDPHVEAILHGLLEGIDVTEILLAEKTHILFATTNPPGDDGKVKLHKEDLKYHKRVLPSVMAQLDGVQPMARVYSLALHQFDGANDFKIGQVPEDLQQANRVSPWAAFEGQVLHDMVSYMHRLGRNPNSTDADLAELKKNCPSSPKTRKRKKPTTIEESASAASSSSAMPAAESSLSTMPANEVTVIPDAKHLNMVIEHIKQCNPDFEQDHFSKAKSVYVCMCVYVYVYVSVYVPVYVNMCMCMCVSVFVCVAVH